MQPPHTIYFIRLRILHRILGALYWRVDDPFRTVYTECSICHATGQISHSRTEQMPFEFPGGTVKSQNLCLLYGRACVRKKTLYKNKIPDATSGQICKQRQWLSLGQYEHIQETIICHSFHLCIAKC